MEVRPECHGAEAGGATNGKVLGLAVARLGNPTRFSGYAFPCARRPEPLESRTRFAADLLRLTRRQNGLV